jgi:hypothetical protein
VTPRLVIFVGAFVAACSPRPSPPTMSELQLDPSWDFGVVPSGKTAVHDVVAYNTGFTTLELASFTNVTGDTVFEPTSTEVRLAPGEKRSISVAFHSDAVLLTRHEATLVLHAFGGTEARTTVVGTSVFVDCSERKPVEFGGLLVGDSLRLPLTVVNDSALPRSIQVPSIYDSTEFNNENPGGWVMQPGESRVVNLDFAPDAIGFFSAPLEIAAQWCPVTVVKLFGQGVSAIAECEATEIKVLPPGSTGLQTILLTNQSVAPLQLDNLSASPGVEFSLVDAGTSVVVPAAHLVAGAEDNSVFVPGELPLVVAITPQGLGERHGEIAARTSIARQPTLSCPLTSYGGGPQIDVQPSSVSVPLDGGTGTLTISNLSKGTGLDDWLHLSSELVRVSGTGPISYAPIPQSIAPGQSIEVDLMSSEPGSWDLILTSNDYDAPKVTVALRAGP